MQSNKKRKNYFVCLIMIFLISLIHSTTAGEGCDSDPDADCMIITPDPSITPKDPGSYSWGGGGNEDPELGSGYYVDPRSVAEREQCRKDVDDLVTKCIDTYTFVGGVGLIAYCTMMARYFGKPAAEACLAFAGAATFKAREWCTAQGEMKKEREC